MKYFIEKEGDLLPFLQQQFPESSNRTLRQWLKVGRILVDGKAAHRADMQIGVGQQVEVAKKVQPARGGFEILYRDQHIVVVNKPEGMLSVATDYQSFGTMHDHLKKECYPKRVFPVHRLDRETTGVMVFALSKEAQTALKEQFEKREVKKTYLAIFEGTLEKREGEWKSYLKEEQNLTVKSYDTPSLGKLAVTSYKVVKKVSLGTLIKLTPLTGRKHQLRVHCSAAGCPIVGDKRYGATQTGKKGRIYLHAETLIFAHPISKKPQRFSVKASW